MSLKEKLLNIQAELKAPRGSIIATAVIITVVVRIY
mgnify:CR=1 FL=1